MQTEINVKQHQLSENEKLLQSLRTEIKVYEKLEEARRKGTGINTHLSLYPLPLQLLPLNMLLSKARRAGSLFLCFRLCLLCKENWPPAAQMLSPWGDCKPEMCQMLAGHPQVSLLAF